MYNVCMKTAVINFKTDEATKAKAQAVSRELGIPLSSLLNAYIHDLVNTGRFHFSTAEPMTKHMEKLIEQSKLDIASGRTSGPFETAEEAITYLKTL